MTNEEAKVFLDNLKICINEHPVVADWLVEIADRKDEPTTEDCSTVPTSSKMEQVEDEPQTCSVNGRPYTDCCNCEHFRCTADEPQTERMKTLDYCDICNHKGCDNCIANNLDDYCVPSGYEPITQTETQNSNLTFEKRTMLDCYNCKRFETEDECIECHYEPKTEPQTDGFTKWAKSVANSYRTEPQTERRCSNCKFLTYKWNKVWCDIKCENPHDVVCDKWKRSSE